MTFEHSEAYRAPTWDDALRTELRVIMALVRRETRSHFGESRLGYLWALIEPILHLFAYIVLFEYVFLRHLAIGRSLTLFMLSGMIPYFLWQKVATYVGAAITGNRSLLNLPEVKLFDVAISRVILEASTYLIVAFLMFGGLRLTGVPEAVPRDPLALAGAIATIIAFGFGTGAINAVLQAYISNWPMFFARLSTPLWLLSGIWFIPGEVPLPWRNYLLYNPIMHLITWFRTGFYPPYTGMYLDKGYALWWSAGSVVLGLTLLRAANRKLLEPT